jgi:precorrin-3B methylase
VAILRLDEFDPAVADMLTLILIGSSHSRSFSSGGGTFAYTPRGYAAGRDHSR